MGFSPWVADLSHTNEKTFLTTPLGSRIVLTIDADRSSCPAQQSRFFIPPESGRTFAYPIATAIYPPIIR